MELYFTLAMTVVRGQLRGKIEIDTIFLSHHVSTDIRKLRPGLRVDFVINNGQADEILPDIASGPIPAHKSKIAAALLALFLGGIGIHKFYLGKSTAGIITLVASFTGIFLLFIPNLLIAIISLIEAVIYLNKSEDEFYDKYVIGDKAWF
ncbi:TM2 domain-containing protein [Aestuariicoccus sp. MJ-SS9]|uniref:TM2 domain-containing protein n=1 Tax=Aestuariicoccus sp. MJ-SS9 TaxID=3079855 RepID=UPI002911178D|nr:NINE protein [Aestuariicoccus sp. MJ-SS9]MDU8912653.1 NINE protein [Aestuariicoccus sp. MJ-SS9]